MRRRRRRWVHEDTTRASKLERQVRRQLKQLLARAWQAIEKPEHLSAALVLVGVRGRQ